MKNNQKGFGKISLLIIIAIIGFLALYELGFVGLPKGSWNPLKAVVALHESLWGPTEQNPPIVMYAKKGDLNNVRNLLDQGTDPNTPGINGIAALMWAASNGQTAIVNLLLERGAHPNMTSKGGSTALIEAAYNGHYEIVQILLTKGANVTIRNNQGKTALDYAQEQKHPEVANLLKSSSTNAK